MDTEPRYATATIYRFPPGGRAALEANERRKKAAASLVPIPSFGSGWYHEAAIREARDAGADPQH